MKKSKAFTLIELLIVVAIVAILAGVVLIAVNPARQMAQARNAERSAEVNAILSAINQFQIDYGALPDCIASADTPYSIGTTANCNLQTAIDLLTARSGNQTIVPGYIAGIPFDPASGCTVVETCTDTFYTVAKTQTDRVTVAAPSAEAVGGSQVIISFTR